MRELKVNTLEGGVLTVQVTPINTIQELKTMLREKKHEDPNERKIVKAEILVDGALVHCDSQTLEAAGLLDAEFEVIVIYSRNAVEAATKEAIDAEGFVQVNIPASLVKISARAFQDCRLLVRVVMADTVRELKVNTLEGGVLTVQVTPINTIQELKTMLREKKHEDPNECKIVKAEILVDGALVHCDSQTLEAAGLLDAEFEVIVIYSRNAVEAATKEAIDAEGFVQVNIPASLVKISARAFQDCRQPVRVVIPESVAAIGVARLLESGSENVAADLGPPPPPADAPVLTSCFQVEPTPPSPPPEKPVLLLKAPASQVEGLGKTQEMAKK